MGTLSSMGTDTSTSDVKDLDKSHMEDTASSAANQGNDLDTSSISSCDYKSESSDYTDAFVIDSDDTSTAGLGWKEYENRGVSLEYVHGVFYTPPGLKHKRVKRTQSPADDHEQDND